MLYLNTHHLKQCILTLESSLLLYQKSKPKTIENEVFRNSIVKGYELAQEIAFKRVKVGSNQTDRLSVDRTGDAVVCPLAEIRRALVIRPCPPSMAMMRMVITMITIESSINKKPLRFVLVGFFDVILKNKFLPEFFINPWQGGIDFFHF